MVTLEGAHDNDVDNDGDDDDDDDDHNVDKVDLMST